MTEDYFERVFSYDMLAKSPLNYVSISNGI